MNLPLPNLDDRTFADLVEEAIAQIPLEYPEWTDHNPTDPGIILIELLAWLTEMTLYRVNQIPDENYASFVSLLQGKQWHLPNNVSAQERQKRLQLELQKTLLELRHRYRAVTKGDYEKLVLEDWNQSRDSTDLKIARVKCLEQRNLDDDTDKIAKGHISLIVVPENNNKLKDEKDKFQQLLNFLNQRKLLTTRLHIVEPNYVSVAVEAELFLKDGTVAEKVKNKAKAEVEKFFHPQRSGKYWQGKGWPFGRSVYLSELYKMLDDLEGVDYVENLQFKGKDKDNQPLADNHLVNFKPKDSTFTIMVKVGNEHKKI